MSALGGGSENAGSEPAAGRLEEKLVSASISGPVRGGEEEEEAVVVTKKPRYCGGRVGRREISGV